MPWLVGIDEAGYGPNLGPLVMSAVACRVPVELADANLWQILRGVVRRTQSRDKQRLLIEDSKLVYSPLRGLAELERGVLATVMTQILEQSCCLDRYVQHVSEQAAFELGEECWYEGVTELPTAAALDDCRQAAERFHQSCATRGVVWDAVRSEVVCPTRFNALLDRWDSKGAVLGEALANLLQSRLALDGDAEPVTVWIDKHGGRNNYAALLQQALPYALVLAEEEGMQRSIYRICGQGREVRIIITPRADSLHFVVALASMASKYLRELLMGELNGFWQRHVPGLRPTAGYPGDAARFYEDIQVAREQLAVPSVAIWRRK